MITKAEQRKRRKLFSSILEDLRLGNWTPRGLDRTLIDCWYAYYRGGFFLNSKGNPRWFNTGDLERLNPDDFKNFHYISRKARTALTRRIQNHPKRDLVKDHVVPLKVIWKMIVSQPRKSVETILTKHYRIAIIARAEDKKLNGLKLRSDMPTSRSHRKSKKWDEIARYRHAKIVVRKGRRA